MANEQDVNQVLNEIQTIKNEISKTIADITLATNKNSLRSFKNEKESDNIKINTDVDPEEIEKTIEFLRDILIPKYRELLKRIKDSELIWVREAKTRDKAPGQEEKYLWLLSKQKFPNPTTSPVRLRIDMLRFEIDKDVDPWVINITGQRWGWIDETWTDFDDINANFANNTHTHIWSHGESDPNQISVWNITEELQIDPEDPMSSQVDEQTNGFNYLNFVKTFIDISVPNPPIDSGEMSIVNRKSLFTMIQVLPGATVETEYLGTDSGSVWNVTDDLGGSTLRTVTYEKLSGETPQILDPINTLSSINYLYVNGNNINYDGIFTSIADSPSIIPLKFVSRMESTLSGGGGFSEESVIEIQSIGNGGDFSYSYNYAGYQFPFSFDYEYTRNGSDPSVAPPIHLPQTDNRGSIKQFINEAITIMQAVGNLYAGELSGTLTTGFTTTRNGVQPQCLMWTDIGIGSDDIDVFGPCVSLPGLPIGISIESAAGFPFRGRLVLPCESTESFGVYSGHFGLSDETPYSIAGKVARASGSVESIATINNIIPFLMQITDSASTTQETSYGPLPGPYDRFGVTTASQTVGSIIGIEESCFNNGSESETHAEDYNTRFTSSPSTNNPSRTYIARNPQASSILDDYEIVGGPGYNAGIDNRQNASLQHDTLLTITRLRSLSNLSDRIIRDFNGTQTFVNVILNESGVEINSSLGDVQVNRVFLGKAKGLYLTTPILNGFGKLGFILNDTEIFGDLEINTVDLFPIPGFNVVGSRRTMDVIDF